jgi:hypothetical protein
MASIILQRWSLSFWSFKRPKRRRFMAMYIYKKRTGSQPSFPGSPGFRVDPPGRPGQLLGGFLLRPEPVPGPSRPGPVSTRRAGPGFKTMTKGIVLDENEQTYN